MGYCQSSLPTSYASSIPSMFSLFCHLSGTRADDNSGTLVTNMYGTTTSATTYLLHLVIADTPILQ